MAELIHLELLSDFFNEIGQSLTFRRVMMRAFDMPPRAPAVISVPQLTE
jgi:hypothetical protein